MDAIIKAFNNVLNFAYNNILSIAMLVLLIAVGLFLTIRTRGFQFRKFGYVTKNTIGSLFQKNLHAKDAGSVSPFQAVTTALAGTISDHSEQESALRRLMIKNSKEQYFLFDNSKYRKRFAFKICSAKTISGVITDLNDVSFEQSN